MKNPSAAWAQIVLVLFTSALTGCLVGGCVGVGASVVVRADPLASLAYGPPAGAFIGFMASGAFLGLSLSAGRRPWLSFGSMGLIIGAGTAAANLMAGLPVGALFLAIIAAALTLGLLATLFWLRSYRRWNDRLKAYQHRA
jgi:hypothetical protein